MNHIRRQLTLYIKESNHNIEKIRAKFNPEQFHLIAAHITLCREDEIEPIEKIIGRIKTINLNKPLRIELNGVERFADGKGVFLSAAENNSEFRELRKTILGQTRLVKEQFPHVTLMHPRNATCNNKIFAELKKQEFPNELFFDKISLIEQTNGSIWHLVSEYLIVNKNVAHHHPI